MVYGDPTYNELSMLEMKNEKRFRLEQVGLHEGSQFEYEYDFGDSWEPSPGGRKDPAARRRRRVPAVHGWQARHTARRFGRRCGAYENMLNIAADPADPQHDEIVEWLPENYDREAFDLNEINETLRQVHGRRTKKAGKMVEADQDMQAELEKLMDPRRWELLMTRESEEVAQELALRRDVIALLEYLRDNKVTGTASTGSFPLKAVAEFASRMVVPPQLEIRAGDQVFRFRSETEVWPVFFLHLLASASGFIEGGAGRRWRLSPTGTEFLIAPSLVQVWSLFSAWWQAIDWVMAFPFSGLDDGLPDGFEDAARDELLASPASIPVPFAQFADRLIARTGFSWPSPEPDFARKIMQDAIERMVIEPLTNFGGIWPVYETREGAGPGQGWRELVAFRLMPFGRGLLETMR